MTGWRRKRCWLIKTLVLGALGLAWSALAADPTPTPTPTPSPAPTSGPQTLSEVARQTSLQNQAAPAQHQGVVISNQNLAEYAAKGALTEVKSPAKAKATWRPAHSATAAGGVTDQNAAESRQEEAKKAYWRGQYQEQKALIAAIKQELEKLDREIPGLWTKFYSWDDPAYRDGVIKVQLDQAVSKREQLAKRLPDEEARLPEILDRARRDGALPGWFRDLN